MNKQLLIALGIGGVVLIAIFAMTSSTTPNGVDCPALGSADFYRLNPKPAGDGWEMVERVPGKPCGGWHRKVRRAIGITI